MKRVALAAIVLAAGIAASWGAEKPLTLPPISASPPIANSALGWWVVVATGPGFDGGVSDMAQREFAAAVRSAVSACGYAIFDEVSLLFTGFPNSHAFQVFAIGGYATKGAAAVVLQKVKPCMPNAYLKAMSLQSE